MGRHRGWLIAVAEGFDVSFDRCCFIGVISIFCSVGGLSEVPRNVLPETFWRNAQWLRNIRPRIFGQLLMNSYLFLPGMRPVPVGAWPYSQGSCGWKRMVLPVVAALGAGAGHCLVNITVYMFCRATASVVCRGSCFCYTSHAAVCDPMWSGWFWLLLVIAGIAGLAPPPHACGPLCRLCPGLGFRARVRFGIFVCI